MPSEDDFWKIVAVSQGQDGVLLDLSAYGGAAGRSLPVDMVGCGLRRQRIRLTTRKAPGRITRADRMPMGDELCHALIAIDNAPTRNGCLLRRKGGTRQAISGIPGISPGVVPEGGGHALWLPCHTAFDRVDSGRKRYSDGGRLKTCCGIENWRPQNGMYGGYSPFVRICGFWKAGCLQQRSTEGFTTNEKGLRVVTS